MTRPLAPECITCGKPGEPCKWTDDAERCMRVQLDEIRARKATELRLILIMAPSYQGGHSEVGLEIANYLDIPFPLTTKNLEAKAKDCGFDPYDLYPWLKKIREGAYDVTKPQELWRRGD